jgi:L-malate glycosyltransferase
MRILLLSDADNPHTLKWASGLSKAGLTVGLFSFRKALSNIYNDIGIKLLNENAYDKNIVSRNLLQKLKYVTAVSSLKKAINTFNPDIVHAHYASSYGMVGALSQFHPFIISVWGSDIYDFPKQGFLQKKLIKFNLSKAEIVCSTSHVMEKETKKFTDKEIVVIPFGVDTDIFRKAPESGSNSIVIGTVKTMDEKYGIRFLVEAFNILRKKYSSLPLKLLLVGSGSQEAYLKTLVRNLNLESDTTFTGFIPNDKVPIYHNKLDIAVYVSTLDSESFGVSVIESSACEKPVVVSRVGGLIEVVDENVTGFVVPPKNAAATADAIEKLLLNPQLQLQMGMEGRKKVLANYELQYCIGKMVETYYSVLK